MSDYERWQDSRLIERIVDHGDGTGLRTTYDAQGQVTATEQVTGLPVVEPAPAAPDVPALLATVQAKADANRAIADTYAPASASMTKRIAENAADGLDAVAEILTTLITPET